MSDRQWTQFALTRLAMAILVTAGLLLVAVPPAVVAVAAGGYGASVLAVESTRRRRSDPARGLVAPLVLADGVLLAAAVAATGGVASPLEILVGLQIVAVALTVSGRVGLEAAVWQASLLLVATPPHEVAAVGTGSVLWHAGAYGLVGVIVAAIASMDRRSERRRERRLQAQIALLADLEPATTTEEACAALARHMVGCGFARSAVIISGSERAIGALAESSTDVILVDGKLPSTAGELLASDSARDVVLRKALDPQADPLLDRLLPGATHLVGVPIVVDGRRAGVAVAEWPRARVPQGMIDRFRRDAAHCGLALRSVLLLEAVEQRSRRDLLTGLTNRQGFDEAFDNELSRIERSRHALSLLLLDLDHFKAVNDTEGHQAGDQVLAAVGLALRRVVRTHDIPARIGGDEFAVLLPECDARTALIVADRARVAVRDAVQKHGVTASVGVATASRNGRTRGAIVRAADEALYAAKAAGRDSTVVSTTGACTEPVLVLDDVEGRVRPHRRADLRSRVVHPAGRGR